MAKSKRKRGYNQEGYINYEFNSWVRETVSVSEKANIKGKIETKKFIKPRTHHQRRFVQNIKDNFISFGVGHPGTGKTLLALHTGVFLLNNDNNPIERLLYVRANVGASFEKGMGYLPGELKDKTMFMADPILDNLYEFMTESSAKLAIQSEKIAVRPVDFLRGRSLSNTVIIIEEAQNIPLEYLFMLITRAGDNSKLVIIGDTQQIDLKKENSGLSECIKRLQSIDCVPIGYTFFDNPNDIQRHRYLQDIVAAFRN